jgi:hypothetical protein
VASLTDHVNNWSDTSKRWLIGQPPHPSIIPVACNHLVTAKSIRSTAHRPSQRHWAMSLASAPLLFRNYGTRSEFPQAALANTLAGVRSRKLPARPLARPLCSAHAAQEMISIS